MFPPPVTLEDHEHSKEENNDPNWPFWLTNVTRTKPYLTLLSESSLRRTLSTVDLTLLGVGTAIGIGIYVMTAKLARDTAGPAVILSIALTSFSVILSGICYAEFSSRVPKCGSAYVYCYAAVGEIWAFIVGWTILVEYVIIIAVLARTCSEYIDFISGEKIYTLFKEKIVTWDNPFLAPFPDFLALALALAVVLIVAVGLRWAIIFNRVMFAFSIIALILLFVISLFLVKQENWTSNFAPHGVQGVLRAAATVYCAFIGLDAIAAVSGEVKRPQSSTPLSIILTVTIATILYCGIATVFTLVTPHDQLAHLAPLAKIFQTIPGAQYLASFGAVSATLVGLLSCSLAGPRILFSMANDGLLFVCFGCLDESSHAFEILTIVVGFLSGCLAALFSTEHLIEVLSIGTLFAYTMVAISVLITRYLPGIEDVEHSKSAKLQRTDQWLQFISMESESYPYTFGDTPNLQRSKFDRKKTNTTKEPNKVSGSNASFAVFLLVTSLSCLAIVFTTVINDILNNKVWAFLSGGISGIFALAAVVFLTRQPRNYPVISTTVPCIPWLPVVTIFVNILLIAELNYWTFVRFGAWLVPGLFIYAFYGYRRSNEALKPKPPSEQDFIIYENPEPDSRIKKIQPKAKQYQDLFSPYIEWARLQ